MQMKDIKTFEIIDAVERSAFSFDIKELSVQMERLVDGLIRLTASMDPRRIGDLERIIININQALTGRDYLLLADLAEYELKPMLAALEGNGGYNG